MKKGKTEVGKRLEEELRKKFGTISAAAKAAGGADASYFGSYLTGRSGLGKLVITKLEKMGIDVNYVLNGREEPKANDQSALRDLLQKKVTDLEYRLSQAASELKEMSDLIQNSGIGK